MPTTQAHWLDWVQRLQAIAQTGLTYTRDPFDRERYESLLRIAAEVAANHSGVSADEVAKLFAAEAGHATPKVDVRGAVFREERILLVRERREGLWTLPGGWAEVNESPGESVVREVREESGFDTRAVKLLAVYDRNRHGHPPHPFHSYKLFFECQLTGGTPAPDGETDAVDFFAENALPPLSLSRVTPAQICRFFAHHRNPAWPADFD